MSAGKTRSPFLGDRPGATPRIFGRLEAVQSGVAPGLLSVLPACILAILLPYIFLLLCRFAILAGEARFEIWAESRLKALLHWSRLFLRLWICRSGLEKSGLTVHEFGSE